MAQQTIDVGTVANDGTGDPLRDAMIKVNDNFGEVYTLVSIIPWNMSTNALPTGGAIGQEYNGTELTTRTTLTDTAGNLLPSKVLAKVIFSPPTTNAHFLFINVLY